ncbi:DNA-directed RNA polymerase I subunit RPA49, partial [Dinochytrium kinnereticum]
NPADIYNIEDLAPSAELRLISIKPLVKAKYAAVIKDQVLKDVPGWILQRLEACLTGGGETATVQQLVYLSYLIRFFKVNESTLNKHEQSRKYFDGVPSIILDSFTQRFTEPTLTETSTRLKIPDRLRDKLLGYIFALALYVEGFKIDVGGFIPVLNVPVNKGVGVCRELGCRIERGKVEGASARSVERIAILSVPLKFPVKGVY